MKLCHNVRVQRGFFIAFALLLALGVFDSGRAAEPAATDTAPNRYAATIAPQERFEVDGVLVERHGNPAVGRPLILIPGLVSGSWAWQDTIRAFSATHPVYVLTLPGFDGRPAASATPFATARAAIGHLIAQRKLQRPVIVGHSLGGTLCFAVAEDKPDAIGGVVAIDGLPAMPGTEAMTPAQRAPLAESMRARMAVAPALFAGQQQSYMRTIGVSDMARADELARLAARSDPASTGQYVADVINLDLRPGLKTIKAPVLLIAPYLDLDMAQQGITESAKLDYYRTLVDGVAKLQVVPVSPARHFAMIDQPEQVTAIIRGFVDAL